MTRDQVATAFRVMKMIESYMNSGFSPEQTASEFLLAAGFLANGLEISKDEMTLLAAKAYDAGHRLQEFALGTAPAPAPASVN